MVSLRFTSAGFEPFALTLDRFRQQIVNGEAAFEEMARYQVTVVNARQFAQQGSPETGRWPALSPRYAAWKARVRPGAPILVFDGDLRREMTVPHAGVYEVSDRQMVVGTAIDYAGYHQRGTPFMPARPLLGAPAKRDSQQFAKIWQRHIIEGNI